MDLTVIAILSKKKKCLGENTEKYITCAVPMEKEVTRIDKIGKEIYLTYYNLLIVQDLCQACCQIL